MKKKRTLFFLFFIFSITQAALPENEDSSLFVVPEILKENVAFWKKIYTEIGLNEAVLHDRDYPQVIFKKVDVEQTSGWAYRRFSENWKSHIAKCLQNVETQPESVWTEEEKSYAALYKAHAPENALAGAHDRVRFQLGQKERFRMGLESSTAYLDTIRAIFDKYNVPKRLAYLPHVESSFNLESYSRVGAAGVWQFMRGTGRQFLHINYLIDERRDPILSTIAAAKLLRSNFQILGAWPLAVTAYNHGANGMKRAVESTGSRDIEVILQRYSSPSFQFASKNFYACFLAASDIAMHASEHFPNLDCAEKLQFKDVKLPSYMRPSVITKYLNIPLNVLREFNPAIRPVVFNQQKQLPAGCEIRVPRDIAPGSMEKLLAAIPDSLKSNEPERSEYYTVQSGDNLLSIASRFGVSVAQLTLDNNINRKNKIYEGQVLRVPQRGTTVAAAPAQAAFAEAIQNQETPVPEERLVEPESSRMPAAAALTWPPKTARANSESIFVSKRPLVPAETTHGPQITKRPVTVSPIAQLSQKEKKAPAAAPAPIPEAALPTTARGLPDSLKEIAVAAAVTSPSPSAGLKPSVLPKFDVEIYNLEITLSPDGSTAQLRVSVDETIGHYADWLDIPTYRIRQLNRMGGRSDIRIGSPILVPADQPSLDKLVKARLEYHMAIEEDFYARYKVTDIKQKTVLRGTALWDICNGQDQIPLWLLKKYNKHLDLGTLIPGAVLWIPVIEEKSDQEIREESSQSGGIYPPFQAPHEAASARGLYKMP